MKITITGSLGNISKPLAEALIKNGHHIAIISNDKKRIEAIESLGAKAIIGSVSDIDFLTGAFKEADAVYTMVPPNWVVSDYVQYIADTGKNYFEAITKAGVKRVVNLSGIGAHLSKDNGSIAGLHRVEETLNTLDGVAIKHLRPGLFFTNFFFDIPTIRNLNVIGNNYSAQTKIAMVHPKDIAEVAAKELQSQFAGKSYVYVVGEEVEMTDAAKILGTAIGKPGLFWNQFSDKEILAGMMAGGMSEPIANLYVEMGRKIGSGILFEDYHRSQPGKGNKRKLIDFANEFAEAYKSQQ